ncbi:uncharacterized protein LOC133336657 [Musca vetustissima]|uniref:uncharacterized protein LOC133336657 n=1 Tax=Musca vetustissima TaxID=27455 RepID=UPI002AB6DDF0|nr:uncharacterized protein LOC133336657 [Musca vetustissima]
MRRSKAPSMLNKSKRFCNPAQNKHENSDPEDEVSLKWGSKDNPSSEHDQFGKNKKLFNIVWRDVSTKKHKTWKGDGTLEVNTATMKAVLKDEVGKYLGCSTRFKLSDLVEEYEMVISGKEIQIQNEIQNEEEIFQLRKRQVTSRNWGSEEWVSPEDQAEEQKKPKGGFYFKPIAELRPPKSSKSLEEFRKQLRNSNTMEKWGTKPNANLFFRENIYKSDNETNVRSAIPSTLDKPTSYKLQNRICFIRPSELQQYLFQQICEYYYEHKDTIDEDSSETRNISNMLQQICNHPSFIKHLPSSNDLVQYLSSSLPVWSEMGPFDSGKLEFLQYYMQTYSAGGDNAKGKFIIIAKNTNTMNMIHGLCDFMDLKCLRLDEQVSMDNKKQKITEYLTTSSENASSKVLLTSSVNNLLLSGANRMQQQQIIVFENVPEVMESLKDLKDINKLHVYYLITAYSIEERQLLPFITLEEILNLYSNINFDDTYCYIHTKIECNCQSNYQHESSKGQIGNEFQKWQHLNAPFDENVLKDYGLDNSSDNLINIFSLTEP